MAKENSRNIKLFALSTCPMCKRVKKQLAEMGVELEIVDVDLLDSGEKWVTIKEVKRHNPAATFPTMVVEEVVLDFSPDNLKKTLKLEDNEDSG